MATVAATSIAACAPGGDDAIDPSRSEDAGAVSLADGRTMYFVANVVVWPGTYHWQDPAHVIDLAEGYGPQILNVSVGTSIAATISVSSTYTPSDSEFSTTLGYDTSTSFDLQASSSLAVPVDAFGRIEAYASFQKATWDVVLRTWPTNTYVGPGVSYKPIGVYFQACDVIAGCLGDSAPGGGPIGVGTGDGPDGGAAEAPDGGAGDGG